MKLEYLEELKKLEAAATRAPWIIGEAEHGCCYTSGIDTEDTADHILDADTQDTALIVAMRNSLPAIIEKLETLHELLAKYELCRWDGIVGDHCMFCNANEGNPTHSPDCEWLKVR